ncbi:uncharacterized protein J8A68_000065, partial [[Candida] subhashii]
MANEKVIYRPGRIQTLTAEQEIILKRTWAYIMKYTGYHLDIDNEDLPYNECFVASTSTQRYGYSNSGPIPLRRTASRTSFTSSKAAQSTMSRRRSLFGSKRETPTTNEGPRPDSRRLRQIQTQSSKERYYPIEIPSQVVYDIYGHYYKSSFEYSEDSTENESDSCFGDTDNESIESFVTASTSFTAFDFSPHYTNGSTKKDQASIFSDIFEERRRVLPKHHSTFLPSMSNYDPTTIHKGMFGGARNDLIDNLVLRYVRARKWDVDKAIAMLFKTLDWR